MSVEDIINRQDQIARGDMNEIDGLPRHAVYSVCNLRGGIGKTTLTVNLAYETDNILVVDTCPQGNTSAFFDENYYSSVTSTAYDLILPYIFPGLGKARGVARKIDSSNEYYAGNKFYIPSNDDFYFLPGQLTAALSQASINLPPAQSVIIRQSVLTSFKNEIKREMSETGVSNCLIDTSPFFSGATHLSWHASDALIIPVRTDQQSINSLELLLALLSAGEKEFLKSSRDLELPSPKIHMVILTHGGWSTGKGDTNKPNAATKVYLQKVYDIVNRHITHFTTSDPTKHIVMVDNLFGSGRVSSVLSKPIGALEAGQSATIDHQKVIVNDSVVKCKNQFKFIKNCLWR